MRIKKTIFGKLEGQEVNKFTLKNSNKIEISIIDYGCRIIKLCTPDKNGKLENIVLGYNTLEKYILDDMYLGCVCGRVAGRIKNATFKLDEKEIYLTKNDGNNHLHGGFKNFSKVIWSSKAYESYNSAYVTFSYRSRDGEEGYPGVLDVEVTYLLTEDNEFIITYKGNTNKKTIVNLTNHSYFNLSGNMKRNISDHIIKVNSDKIAELDSSLIPTGNLIDVKNTPFDLNKGSMFKDIFTSIPRGFDHPFLLNSNFNNEIILLDKESGRTLTLDTDQECVVIYTSNSMPGHLKHIAVCLETQGLPDAINHEHFTPIKLDTNETYNAKTKYTFNVM